MGQRKKELLPEMTYTEADERVSSISVGMIATIVITSLLLVLFGLDFPVMKSHFIKGVRRVSQKPR